MLGPARGVVYVCARAQKPTYRTQREPAQPVFVSVRPQCTAKQSRTSHSAAQRGWRARKRRQRFWCAAKRPLCAVRARATNWPQMMIDSLGKRAVSLLILIDELSNCAHTYTHTHTQVAIISTKTTTTTTHTHERNLATPARFTLPQQ